MPRFGNPDLLISVGASASLPALPPSGTSVWSSMSYIGADAIDVLGTDSAVRAGCPRTSRSGSMCLFTIGIYGNDFSGFSIVASLDGRVLPLVAGQPIVLSGTPGLFTYYRFNSTMALPTPTPSRSASMTATMTMTGTVTASAVPSGVPSGAATPTSSGAAVSNATSGGSAGGSTASGAASSSPTGVPAAGGSPSPAPGFTTLPAVLLPAGSPVVFELTAISGQPAIYLSSSATVAAGTGSTKPSDGGGACLYYDFAAPTTTSASSSSSLLGRIVISPGDPCFCAAPCTYYVGIGSEVAASLYAVLAVEGPMADTTVINLLDGLAQDGAAPAGGGAMFDFEFVPASASIVPGGGLGKLVTVSLSQYSGATALYAVVEGPNVPPASPSFYHYSAFAVGGSATFAVSGSDAPIATYCGGPNSSALCTLEIYVAATTYAEFSLTARTNLGVILDDGRSEIETVAVGSVAYFKYLQVTTGDVVISATPFAGAVDIFVGSSGLTGMLYPSSSRYTWRAVGSAASGNTAQAVAVSQTSAAALACPFPCFYSIAVVPSASVTDAGAIVAFSVMARTRTGAPTPLLDGEPLADYTTAGDANYYIVILPASASSVTVAATLASGDNSAAVGIAPALNVVAMPVATGMGSLPDPLTPGTGATFTSPVVTATGVETSVTVQRSDPAVLAACPPKASALLGASPSPMPCRLVVAVSSAAGGLYTVTAVSGSRFLQDGVPLAATAPAGASLSFIFVAATGATHVQLTLTSLAGTAVGTVTPAGVAPGPAPSWSLGGLGSATLMLDASAAGCAGAAGGGLCAFAVTVTSLYAGNPAVFTIQGSSSALASLRLGVPASGSSGPTGYALFSLFVPAGTPGAAAGLSVVVQAQSGGWATLFAANAVNPTTNLTLIPTAACAAPSPGAAPCDYTRAVASTVQWAAPALSAYRNKLVISGNDARWVLGTTYVFAVTAAIAPTDFTITAFLTGTPLTLTAGAPMTDIVAPLPAPGAAAPALPTALFYSALIAAASAGVGGVTIQVTPYDGDVVVAVSLNTSAAFAVAGRGPGVGFPAQYVAGASNAYRVDISGAAVAAACGAGAPITGLCSIAISVTATSLNAGPVTYSIITTAAAVAGGAPAAPTRLLPGEFQTGALPAGVWAYYYVPVNTTATPGATVFVNHVQLGGSASVYVSTDGTLPNATQYGATAAAVLGVTYIGLMPGMPAYRQGVYTLTIGVYGLSGVAYTLSSGIVGTTVTELPPGASLQARVAPGGFAYFSLRVGSTPGDVFAGVAVLAGGALVYASRWDSPPVNLAFRPTAANAQWFGAGSNTILASASDANACWNCVYIFAVYCDPHSAVGGTACAFIASASTSKGALTRLIDGVPARTRATTGVSRYFSYAAPTGSVPAITLSASTSVGEVQLWVADRFAPSGAMAALLPGPSNYSWMSLPGSPTVSWAQKDAAPPASAAFSGLHYYSIAANVLSGPSVFNMRASGGGNPVLLLPGEAVASNLLPAGATTYFAFELGELPRG